MGGENRKWTILSGRPPYNNTISLCCADSDYVNTEAYHTIFPAAKDFKK